LKVAQHSPTLSFIDYRCWLCVVWAGKWERRGRSVCLFQATRSSSGPENTSDRCSKYRKT
jgi:hypothetical protein